MGALDDGAGVVKKDVALRGKLDRSAGSVEQAHAQLALERRNRVADRCLDNVTHFSRAGETAHLCDGDKVFELANFHTPKPPISRGVRMMKPLTSRSLTYLYDLRRERM